MHRTSHTWIIDRFRERFDAYETMNSGLFRNTADRQTERQYKLRIYSRRSDRARFEFHLHRIPVEPDAKDRRLVIHMGILNSAELWSGDFWFMPEQLLNATYDTLEGGFNCVCYKSVSQARVANDVFAHVRHDGTLHVGCEIFQFDKSGTGDPLASTATVNVVPWPIPDASASPLREQSSQKRPASSPASPSRRNLLDTGFLADCTLVSSGSVAGGAERFRAHKCVLASKSEVFGAMFGSPGFVESKDNSEIALENTSAQCLREVLPWIYQDQFAVADDIHSLEEALEFAHQYGVDDLKARCEQKLVTMLNPTNVVDLHGISVLFGVDALKAATIEFLSCNVHTVLQTTAWSQLKRHRPSVAFDLLEEASLLNHAITDERLTIQNVPPGQIEGAPIQDDLPTTSSQNPSPQLGDNAAATPFPQSVTDDEETAPNRSATVVGGSRDVLILPREPTNEIRIGNAREMEVPVPVPVMAGARDYSSSSLSSTSDSEPGDGPSVQAGTSRVSVYWVSDLDSSDDPDERML